MKTLMLISVILLVLGCGKSEVETSKKPVKELTKEDIVGTYGYKDEDGDTIKVVVLENGIGESYLNGRLGFKKYNEGKWKMSKEGEIHIEWKDGDIVYRINKDGSITGIVAEIPINGKRKAIPKDKQITFKKIK